MSQYSPVIVEVLILQRFPYGQDSTFFYYSTEKRFKNLSVGDIVVVPWRKGTKNGVIIGTKKIYTDASASDFLQINLNGLVDKKCFHSSIPDRSIELKPIKKLLEKRFLSPDLLEKLNLAARQHGVSWNHFVSYAINLPPSRINNKFPFLFSLSEWSRQLGKIYGGLPRKTKIRMINKENLHPLTFLSQEQSWQLGSLIKENIEKNKKILVIVPEKTHLVPIAAKYAVISNNFSISSPIILGKILPPGVYRSAWQLTKKNSPYIFVGTRSAIFAPYLNLGLIIIEEGHDVSHKQWDLAPLYDVRDLLPLVYPKIAKLYISSTPRLQDFYSSPCYLKLSGSNYESKTIVWSKSPKTSNPPITQEEKEPPYLLKRSLTYDNIKKTVTLVNLDKERDFFEDPAALSTHFTKNLIDCLKSGQWGVILANHGGFAYTIVCRDCGLIPRCPNCGKYLKIQLKNSFYCSFCGRSSSAYTRCPNCAGHSFRMFNFGLDSLKEKLNELQREINFKLIIPPDLRSSNKNLLAYWRGLVDHVSKPAVIIGYSGMIAPARLLKDNIGLAGSISFDNVLYYPDYRSEEKAAALFYNLLALANKIIIQTKNPLSTIWSKLLRLSYSALFPQWINERQKFLYPPAVKLIRIDVAGMGKNNLSHGLKELILREKSVYDVLEVPTPPKNYIASFLVKYRTDADLSLLLSKIAPKMPKLKVDPDPEVLI